MQIYTKNVTMERRRYSENNLVDADGSDQTLHLRDVLSFGIILGQSLSGVPCFPFRLALQVQHSGFS